MRSYIGFRSAVFFSYFWHAHRHTREPYELRKLYLLRSACNKNSIPIPTPLWRKNTRMTEDGGMASMSVWQAYPSRIPNEIPRVPAHYSYSERRYLVRIYIRNASARSANTIGCGIRSTTVRRTLAVDHTDDITPITRYAVLNCTSDLHVSFPLSWIC